MNLENLFENLFWESFFIIWESFFLSEFFLKRFVFHLMKLLKIVLSPRIFAWFATFLFSKCHHKPKFRFRNSNSNSAKWKRRNSKLRNPNSAIWNFPIWGGNWGDWKEGIFEGNWKGIGRRWIGILDFRNSMSCPTYTNRNIEFLPRRNGIKISSPLGNFKLPTWKIPQNTNKI